MVPSWVSSHRFISVPLSSQSLQSPPITFPYYSCQPAIEISPPPYHHIHQIKSLPFPCCRSLQYSAAVADLSPHSSLFRYYRPRVSLNTNQRTAAMVVNGKQAPERFAVVTGANKGIGLETVRQLAASGVTVVLTARDEKRGIEAKESLHGFGLSNVFFHQLDVQDPKSIESLVKFLDRQFGKLDILVNNAGASGVMVDEDGLRALNIDPASWLSGKATNMVQGVIKTTYEKAKECLNTNYYGVKSVTEALLPLLKLSTSGARIVNVSSLRGELRRIPSEQTRKELGDLETLTEEKIDKIVEKFLHDLKNDALEANGWSKMLPAYSVSKVTVNAYTRVLAKKYPNMRINCVHPGFVNTDLNWHTGTMTLEEGAEGSVMLALLPEGGPTGCYFDRTQVADF